MARGGKSTNPSGDNKATKATDKAVDRASTNTDSNKALRDAIKGR
jgi:hypothetical protein